jgi:hypothetical protein
MLLQLHLREVQAVHNPETLNLEMLDICSHEQIKSLPNVAVDCMNLTFGSGLHLNLKFY